MVDLSRFRNLSIIAHVDHGKSTLADRILELTGAVDARDEAAAAVLLGMKGSTFPAKKALTQARLLGHDKILRAFTLLAEADLDLRKFRKDWPEELVMEVLVGRLCQLSSRQRR